MKHTAYYLNWKGHNLHVQEWMPADHPKAHIALIHGQSDHSGRYAHVATFFTERQMAVSAIDLVGHGKSQGKRGHVAAFTDYLDQADLLLNDVLTKTPECPVFLYGHSMGGLITLAHSINRSGKVRGYIATSPWLRLAFDPPAWRIQLGKLVAKVFPALSQPVELDAGLLAHPPEVARAYTADPLVHGKITPAAFLAIVDKGEQLLQHQGALQLPMLVVHGSGDKITDHSASALFCENHSNVDYVELTGLYHEMHNETEQDELFHIIDNWIIKQLSI
ncbi:MAG: hypothetical protein ABR95_03060 [Sphingobacteriales bacterium BACL12 MAG-120813-bin55]|jgi:acylglycerol lipase|nr:MAG: hypothetical protein ABR94_01275 [Sphingobacteriales bacterium BACL12 MAG-120802-bin5]KRP12625.1 MAG: hypothetical protein ABR95_03060 [Sphingobacteriales bacterium BACL12 MAG-120813-bin55]